jgi:hypothetical protein
LNPIELLVHKMIVRRRELLKMDSSVDGMTSLVFFDARRREMTICTSRIKATESSEQDQMINQTLMHESVHLAQACKDGTGYLAPFGLKRSTMILAASRQAGLRKVVAFDSRLAFIDHEAFYMEDKPEKVQYVVRKYYF